MDITKVELLWARTCPLKCVGCTMPNDDIKHEGTLEQWQQGITRIREIGSKFVAIYGAEPLTRMDLLPEVITKIYEEGMKCTLITAIPKHPNLKKLISSCPLDSLTVSYDGIYEDVYRKAKSKAGWTILTENPQIRDRAVVATVTDKNVMQIPAMAKRATDNDIWFLFDLYHKGYDGFIAKLGKCGNDDSSTDAPTRGQLLIMAEALLILKEEGKKIHCSADYLKALIKDYNGNPRKFWHCRNRKAGWLTIDADGAIMPCDDWQVKFIGGTIWDKNWIPYDLEVWKNKVVQGCPGCSWNTHWDAVAIEEGMGIGSYVH